MSRAKILRIGIASRAQMKARTLAVARGEHKRGGGRAESMVHLDGIAGAGAVE